MNRPLTCQLLIVMSFLQFSITAAQWTQVSGPYGYGSASCFLLKGETVYVGAGAGFFCSSDHGTTWTLSSQDLPRGSFQALARAGDHLFASVNTSGVSSGVFRSSDNGNSWMAVYNVALTALAAVDSSVLCGSPGYSVYVSTDLGATWSIKTSPLPPGDRFILDLVADGTDLYAGTTDGLYLSADTCVSWQLIVDGGTTGRVHHVMLVDSAIYLGADNGVYYTPYLGAGWTCLNGTAPLSKVRCLLRVDGTLYAGVYNDTGSVALYRTTDGGVNWAPIDLELASGSIYDLLQSGSNILVGTGSDGVVRSSDAGNSWLRSNEGLNNSNIGQLVTHAGAIFAVAGYGGIFRALDPGGNWSACNEGLSERRIRSFFSTGATLYVGTYTAGVYVSSNDGAAWSGSNTGLTSMNISSIVGSADTVFLGTVSPAGLFRSTNGGSSWGTANTGIEDVSPRDIAVEAGNVFVLGYLGHLYASTDNGASWTEPNTDVGTNISVQCLMTYGDRLIAGSTNGIYLSTDRAATWGHVLDRALPSDYLEVRDFTPYESVVFASTTMGVYFSEDSGASWRATPRTLHTPAFDHLAVSGDDLVGGTSGSGIWRASIKALLPPLPPENPLVTDSSSGTVTLMWNKCREPDFLRYTIYYRTASGVAQEAGSCYDVLDTVWTFAGLPVGERYYFKVAAVDSFGNRSDYSAEVDGASQPLLLGEGPSDWGMPLLLFHMNEQERASVGDASGNGYNGSTSGTSIVPGRFGFAREFNGSTDFVRVRNSTGLNPSSEMTVQAWIRTTTQTAQVIIAKYDIGSGMASAKGFMLALTDSGRLAFRIGFGADQVGIQGVTPVNDGRWHHVAGAYGIGTMRLYLDGDLETLHAESRSPNASSVEVLIGGVRNDTLVQEPFNGAIDEVRITGSYYVPQQYYVRIRPQYVSASPSSGKITLAWTDGGGFIPLMRYRIYRGLDSASVSFIDSTTATTYMNSGLVNGTWYYYRVSAVDSTGFESSLSSAAIGVPGDFAAPSAPVNLTAEAGDGQVTLKWNRNHEPDILRYLIYGGPSQQTPLLIDSTTAGDPGDTSKTITGLTNGQTYKFNVTAVDSSLNQSVFSSQVSATPQLASSVENKEGLIPTEYFLSQNYPNPFNPSTTIKYGLPEGCRVNLEVYDLLGQKVATLVDEVQDAGYKSVQFECSGLGSGTYLYRLNAGSAVRTRKMLLLR